MFAVWLLELHSAEQNELSQITTSIHTHKKTHTFEAYNSSNIGHSSINGMFALTTISLISILSVYTPDQITIKMHSLSFILAK